MNTLKNTLRLSFLVLGLSHALYGAETAENLPPTPPEFNMKALGEIPILHEGRVKPLYTFARIHLLAFNGKSSLDGMNAMSWLMESLYDHTSAFRRRIFNIADPAATDALGLERREGHRYSFEELARGLESSKDFLQKLFEMKENDRTATQNTLVELAEKSVRYEEISQSLVLFFPNYGVHSKKIATLLGIEADHGISFMELRKNHTFETSLKALYQDKTKKLDDSEKSEIENLVSHWVHDQQAVNTQIFRVIPPQWEQSQDVWLSPTGLISSGLGSPATSQYLRLWESLYDTYREKDLKAWSEISEKLLIEAQNESRPIVRTWRIQLENIYNGFDFFTKSLTFYILAFLLLSLSWLMSPKRLTQAAWVSLLVGASFHLVGLVLRMTIMMRPPVSTLYESIVFVGLIIVVFSIILESFRKDTLGILMGSLAGGVLQMISLRYETSGDTMGMLAAVLDTNFWLATHVVCITIGYGCCFLTGLLGHLYLILRLVKPNEQKKADEIHRNMVGASLIALFFSMFGTILGGIWADQSWGRFWGWDPKENGALLIVLWLLFLIHARLAGMLGKTAHAAGMVFTNVVVALAWFGVNLLNVGLHSYGFTSNIAINLGVFCTVETLFAAFFFIAVRRKYEL